MQVFTLQNCSINKNYTKKLKVQTFKASRTVQYASFKASGKVEYSLRVVVNKLSDLFASKSLKNFTKTIASLTPKRNKEFLNNLNEIARFYSSKKCIITNIDDKNLEQIAEKGDSTIFMMNHSNQSEDPQMLAVLNTLLAEAYKEKQVETFPLPKIILNEDILKTMNPTKRKAFENFGAVGIDANVIGGDKDVNTKAFFPVIKDFVRNKCNIFIFPEGRLAVRRDLDFFQRFQSGVANMVDKILNLKKEVRVVPVGFAYGKDDKKDLASMNIGTPIIIKRHNGVTSITKGDIEKEPLSPLFSFFEKHKDEEDIAITSNRVAVQKGEIVEYLKTILSENLEINLALAEEGLLEPFEESEVIIV